MLVDLPDFADPDRPGARPFVGFAGCPERLPVGDCFVGVEREDVRRLERQGELQQPLPRSPFVLEERMAPTCA